MFQNMKNILIHVKTVLFWQSIEYKVNTNTPPLKVIKSTFKPV